MLNYEKYIDYGNFKNQPAKMDAYGGEEKECLEHVTDNLAKFKNIYFLNFEDVCMMNTERKKKNALGWWCGGWYLLGMG